MRFRLGHLMTAFCAMAACFLLESPAQASQVAYEGFSLTFPSYDTGNGFSGAWAVGGFNAFAAGYTSSDGSLFYVNGHGKAGGQGNGDDANHGKAGLQTSGGSISGGAFSAINGAIRNLAQPLGTDNTTVYISFLIQPQGALNNGIFNGFFGLTLNGSFAQDLFIGKPGGGAVTDYVLETRGGFGQISSGIPAAVGQTALLVVKAQFLSGNDIFTLYVNPVPGQPEPATGAVKGDLNLGKVSAVGIYSSGAFALDEIRIGTTFADVTPAHDGDGRHD